jgi:hypothetical protein
MIYSRRMRPAGHAALKGKRRDRRKAGKKKRALRRCRHNGG